MSKSLGNSPEPLDLIAEYGADAVRFTILYLAPLGQDILYAREKNELGRNFANKIWNAGRFLLMNRDQIGETRRHGDFTLDECDLADRWILSRYHSTAADVAIAFDAYDINKAVKTIYDFFWHDYCDWYVEMIKSRLYGNEPAETKKLVVARALDIFDAALRLLHPVMPFVTEELWQNIRSRKPDESIMRAPMAKVNTGFIDTSVERQMQFVQNVIDAVRNIRGEMNIPPSKELTLALRLSSSRSEEDVRAFEGYLLRLARVTSLVFVGSGAPPRKSASAVVDGEELFIPLEGLIDLDAERSRLKKEIDRVIGLIGGIRGKLGNASFVEKAPKEVVEKEKEKLKTFEETVAKLQKNFDNLG